MKKAIRPPATTRRRAFGALILGALALPLSVSAQPVAAGASSAAELLGSSVVATMTFHAGQYLASPNGAYQALLQSDGNFVVSSAGSGAVLFQTSTAGYVGATLTVSSTTAQLVLKGSAGRTRWTSPGNGRPATTLELLNDGNLVFYGPSGINWSSAPVTTASPAGLSLGSSVASGQVLHAGQYLLSPNGLWETIFRSDGNVATYLLAGTPLQVWQTATANPLGALGVGSGSGGQLVFTGGGGGIRWSSGTNGTSIAALKLQNDGTLVLRGPTGIAWTSATGPAAAPIVLSVGSSLPTSSSLTSGQYLVSPDGAYETELQPSGNLVTYQLSTMNAIWYKLGSPGSSLGYAANGQLTLFSASHGVLWQSGATPGPGDPVSLESTGSLSQYTIGGVLAWRAGAGSTGSTDSTLGARQSLFSGQYLVSPNGTVATVLNGAGDLVTLSTPLSLASTVFWRAGASSTSPTPSFSLSASGTPTISGSTWSGGAAPGPGNVVSMADTGVLSELTPGGLVAWSATGASTGTTTGNTNSSLFAGQTLAAGQALISPSGAVETQMFSNGNLVTFRLPTLTLASVVWQSATAGYPGATLTVQASPANLLIADATSTTRWTSGNNGRTGRLLLLGDDGNLVFQGPAGIVWTSQTGPYFLLPTNVGVYAYPDPQANVMNDGWPILGDTGGLGTTTAPFVDTTQPNDFLSGLAIQASGRAVPWLSFWTASGPGCANNASPWGIYGQTQAFGNGYQAGVAVAAKIDGYASGGLTIKPSYVIFDPEGYPDAHSGLDCGVSSASSQAWRDMLDGWVAGLHRVDPSLNAGFYAAQGEMQAYGLINIQDLTGAPIPAFLAVAFGYSGNPGSPLINPSPIYGIPYGAAQIASSNIKGVISFYAGGTQHGECSPLWLSTAAQVISNWGAPLNTLQFDPGMRCTTAGQQIGP